MTTVVVHFTAKPGQRDALTDALASAIQGTIDKPECHKVQLMVDDDHADRFAMVEEWTSAQAHKAYAQALMSDPKMAPLMELMAGPPDVRYLSHRAAGGGEWGGPGHLEISSEDVDATKAFLTDVFNWRFTPMMEGYDGFWAPGALSGGLRPKMAEEPCAQSIPYLIVDDLDARLKRVEAAGGTITVPIQEIPHAGRFFWFMTPGGLQLAAWESAPKA